MRARILGANRRMSSAVRRKAHVGTLCPRVARGLPESGFRLSPMSIAKRLAYGLAYTLRGISFCMFAISLALVVTVVVYDIREFQPRRPEIDAMLAAAKPLERSPPPLLVALQRAGSRGNIDWLATRLILKKIDRDVPRMSSLAWQFRWWCLAKAVDLHLSENEQMRIVLSRESMGGDIYGYADGALDVFGRPLDELDDMELAQLVAITHWPSKFRKPEFEEARESAAKSLLTRVHSAQ